MVEFLSEDKVLVAPVTKRIGRDNQPYFSFAILRNLPPEDDGSPRQTHWLQKRHLVGAMKLLKQVESFLDAEIEKARVVTG